MLQEADVGSEAERSEALSIRANKLDILERLADDLAHEIRNPLHSMVINLEVLKRRVSRWSAEEQTDALRYIGVLGTELDRVTRRIDLLLRLTRPARRAEPATLDELVAELMELVQIEGRRQEVEVRYESAAQLARVHVPREPVRQVILDLILHALDHLGPGGTLLIRTTQDGERASISVSATDAEGAPVPLEGNGAAGPAVARLPVARALADEIGGLVEPSDGPVMTFSVPVQRG